MTDRDSDIDDGGLDEQTNALLAHVRALAIQSDSESDNDSDADLGGMGEFTAALGSLVREGHIPRSTEVKILSDFSTHAIERIPFGTLIPANVPPSPDRPRLSFEDILENLKNGKYKNIMLCVGAGISTAAGIPDFRTPGTGLYDNLAKYNLSKAEDVFCIDYFSSNPAPFYNLARELRPGKFKSTMTHHLIALLAEKGILLRCYTQNIDGLERQAGVESKYLVEAHGTFSTASCPFCSTSVDIDKMNKALDDEIPLKCSKPMFDDSPDLCNQYVKPDIVFFGEGLSKRFFNSQILDVEKADLCITMGTSLSVPPFCYLPEAVKDDCDNLLVNRDRVGPWEETKPNFNAFYQGSSDDAAVKIAEAIGLEDELKRRHQADV